MWLASSARVLSARNWRLAVTAGYLWTIFLVLFVLTPSELADGLRATYLPLRLWTYAFTVCLLLQTVIVVRVWLPVTRRALLRIPRRSRVPAALVSAWMLLTGAGGLFLTNLGLGNAKTLSDTQVNVIAVLSSAREVPVDTELTVDAEMLWRLLLTPRVPAASRLSEFSILIVAPEGEFLKEDDLGELAGEYTNGATTQVTTEVSPIDYAREGVAPWTTIYLGQYEPAMASLQLTTVHVKRGSGRDNGGWPRGVSMNFEPPPGHRVNTPAGSTLLVPPVLTPDFCSIDVDDYTILPTPVRSGAGRARWYCKTSKGIDAARSSVRLDLVGDWVLTQAQPGAQVDQDGVPFWQVPSRSRDAINISLASPSQSQRRQQYSLWGGLLIGLCSGVLGNIVITGATVMANRPPTDDAPSVPSGDPPATDSAGTVKEISKPAILTVVLLMWTFRRLVRRS